MFLLLILKKPLSFVVSLCLLSTPAFAGELIMINATIPYVSNDAASEDIRVECDWNQQLAQNIVKKSKATVKVTDDDLTNISGKKLVITVNQVRAVSSDLDKGKKWAHIRGNLIENGNVIGSFNALRITSRGSNVCSTLNRLGLELADDVAEWLKNPTMDAPLGDV